MTHTHPPSGPPILTRLQALSLLAAPVVAVAARLLWTPYDEEEPARYIAELGRHPGRSSLGAYLMVISALLLVPAVFALASIVRDRAPRTARVATVMTVTGAFGMAALCSVALVATHLAQQPDPAAVADLWNGFFTDSTSELVFIAVLVGVAGFVLLGIGLYKTPEVPRTAAVLTGVGGAATLFTSGGPEQALLITAALLGLAGFGWIAITCTQPSRRAGVRREASVSGTSSRVAMANR
jgi:Domain of unknown function (DUF4386)